MARFFASGSIWNRPLADDAPLDRDSAAYVRELRRQAAPRRLGGWGSGIMIKRFGVPIYTVDADQPGVQVALDNRAPLLAEAFASVPMPADARPARGTDGNIAIYQPSTDTLWEFWKARRRADGWHARWGGKMTNVSRSPGHYRELRDESNQLVQRAHWGTTSAKFSLVAGVMTTREVRSGRIPHALNVGVPQARKDVWSLPAGGTDGRSSRPCAIPQGAHFRLDPDVDVDRLGLPPVVAMMARAAQRYGIIVVNTSGGVGFRAEDPGSSATNPWPRLLGGRNSTEVMQSFPWKHLQLLPLELRRREGPAGKGAPTERPKQC